MEKLEKARSNLLLWFLMLPVLFATSLLTMSFAAYIRYNLSQQQGFLLFLIVGMSLFPLMHLVGKEYTLRAIDANRAYVYGDEMGEEEDEM